MDGAIEASRLAGNDQTLAWDLMNRAFVDVHRGEMESAMAAAEESMELTRDFGDGFVVDARRRHARDRPPGERRARPRRSTCS